MCRISGHMLYLDWILSSGPVYIVYNVQSAGHPLGRLKRHNVTILSTYPTHIWTEWPHYPPCALHRSPSSGISDFILAIILAASMADTPAFDKAAQNQFARLLIAGGMRHVDKPLQKARALLVHKWDLCLNVQLMEWIAVGWGLQNSLPAANL